LIIHFQPELKLRRQAREIRLDPGEEPDLFTFVNRRSGAVRIVLPLDPDLQVTEAVRAGGALC
jgi:hypothetical protein